MRVLAVPLETYPCSYQRCFRDRKIHHQSRPVFYPGDPNDHTSHSSRSISCQLFTTSHHLCYLSFFYLQDGYQTLNQYSSSILLFSKQICKIGSFLLSYHLSLHPNRWQILSKVVTIPSVDVQNSGLRAIQVCYRNFFHQLCVARLLLWLRLLPHFHRDQFQYSRYLQRSNMLPVYLN